jgi:hypothetical protein
MRCLTCGILLNVECTNPSCRSIHGQATGKQCDWCARKAHEAVTLLNSALLQYTDVTDLVQHHAQEPQRGRDRGALLLQRA